MNLFTLTKKNLLDRPLATFLSMLLVTLAVSLTSFAIHINQSVNSQLDNNIRGIDMVVGAKGSPLQLILSAVLQIDAPTGNISLSEAKKIQKHRLVKYGIPLSYGDTYNGFRIIGTDTSYLNLYNVKLKEGRNWNSAFEVSIGAMVARNLDLKIGDEFLGAHGLTEEGAHHESHSYKIVGIYEYTSTVVDQLILTATESVWQIHHNDEPTIQADREITAMLVKFRNPMGVIQLPRWVNTKTKMQAAVPGYELKRLNNLLGIGFDALNVISVIIMMVAGISIFISLYASLKERQTEMALMRSYGASRSQLATLLLLEGVFITLSGFLSGIILSRVGFLIVSNLIAHDFNYQLTGLLFSAKELYLLGLVIGIGILSSIIPVLQVMKINISKALAEI